MIPNVSQKQLLNGLGIVVLILLVAPFVAYAVPQAIGATQSYVVMSGSMSPTINTGDVIFVYDRDPNTIQEGDIITYDLSGEETEVTTHRVVDIVEGDDGERLFVTKGDANEEPDQYQVPADSVIGVMPRGGTLPAIVPYLGRALLFAQSKLGIALLVFLPVGLLIVSEGWELYREVTGAGENETTTVTQESKESETPPDQGPNRGEVHGEDD